MALGAEKKILRRRPAPTGPVVHLLKDMKGNDVKMKCGAEGKKGSIVGTVWWRDVTCGGCNAKS